MTSRQPPPPATAVFIHHRRQSHLLLLLTAVFPSLIFLLLLFLLFLYLYFSHCRSPSPSPPPLRRFSYRELHSATSGFSASRSLGRGASASVFLGTLADGSSVAVKRLHLSGDREFMNELRLLSSLSRSHFVVSLLGYCAEGDQRRLIVYEYMSNGSLQEVLFGSRRRLRMDWSLRFRIILGVAKALAFLHFRDLPIVHGDIKPGNVLLGADFEAKISDFGLSRLRDEASTEMLSVSAEVDSILPIPTSSSSPCLNHGKNVSRIGRTMGKESAVRPCGDEVENNDNYFHRKKDERREVSSGDYVRGWIRSRIFPAKVQKSSLEFRNLKFEEGGRKIREWWKEEYFAEISKKGKGDEGMKCCGDDSSSYNGCNNHRDDGELNVNISFRNGWKKKKKKKKQKKKSRSVSSGDLFSKELSSTRSMRGTVCYIAPEYSGCGNLTEKADMYNFGVLILVIISGRRPLHLLESPVKLDRANLISWCRKLAQTGNVLDIVDEKLNDSYNKDQVSLCINIALLCLQRTPDLRPDSWDIVKVLEGEKELPVVPIESSTPPTTKKEVFAI